MDCKTGKIHPLDTQDLEGQLKHFSSERGRELLPLSENQNKTIKLMSRANRKNYMRNQPCVCGSGKKFKKCCWSKYT